MQFFLLYNFLVNSVSRIMFCMFCFYHFFNIFFKLQKEKNSIERQKLINENFCFKKINKLKKNNF